MHLVSAKLLNNKNTYLLADSIDPFRNIFSTRRFPLICVCPRICNFDEISCVLLRLKYFSARFFKLTSFIFPYKNNVHQKYLKTKQKSENTHGSIYNIFDKCISLEIKLSSKFNILFRNPHIIKKIIHLIIIQIIKFCFL